MNDRLTNQISHYELQATIQSMNQFGAGLTSAINGKLESDCKIAAHYLEILLTSMQREKKLREALEKIYKYDDRDDSKYMTLKWIKKIAFDALKSCEYREESEK